jgi:hypothetical protein
VRTSATAHGNETPLRPRGAVTARQAGCCEGGAVFCDRAVLSPHMVLGRGADASSPLASRRRICSFCRCRCRLSSAVAAATPPRLNRLSSPSRRHVAAEGARHACPGVNAGERPCHHPHTSVAVEQARTATHPPAHTDTRQLYRRTRPLPTSFEWDKLGGRSDRVDSLRTSFYVCNAAFSTLPPDLSGTRAWCGGSRTEDVVAQCPPSLGTVAWGNHTWSRPANRRTVSE